MKLWNNRIYSTWEDNRAGGTGFDIWANVLDWDNPVNPVGISGNEPYQIPSVFILNQNYPNPFSARGGSAFGGNPSTIIKFALPRKEEVRIEVFNLLGQKVAVLINKTMSAGYHEVEFNAQDLPSGLYVYLIEAGQYQAVKKMLLLR